MENPQWVVYAKKDLCISMDHKLHMSNSMSQLQNKQVQSQAQVSRYGIDWNGMGWDRMGWDEMERNATLQNRIEYLAKCDQMHKEIVSGAEALNQR